MLFFSRSKIPRCLAPLSIEPPPSSPLKNWQHFAGAWARTTPASWGFDSPPPHTHTIGGSAPGGGPRSPGGASAGAPTRRAFGPNWSGGQTQGDGRYTAGTTISPTLPPEKVPWLGREKNPGWKIFRGLGCVSFLMGLFCLRSI